MKTPLKSISRYGRCMILRKSRFEPDLHRFATFDSPSGKQLHS